MKPTKTDKQLVAELLRMQQAFEARSYEAGDLDTDRYWQERADLVAEAAKRLKKLANV